MDSTTARIKALIDSARMEVSCATCELSGHPLVFEALENADELLGMALELIRSEDDDAEDLDFEDIEKW